MNSLEGYQRIAEHLNDSSITYHPELRSLHIQQPHYEAWISDELRAAHIPLRHMLELARQEITIAQEDPYGRRNLDPDANTSGPDLPERFVQVLSTEINERLPIAVAVKGNARKANISPEDMMEQYLLMRQVEPFFERTFPATHEGARLRMAKVYAALSIGEESFLFLEYIPDARRLRQVEMPVSDDFLPPGSTLPGIQEFLMGQFPDMTDFLAKLELPKIRGFLRNEYPDLQALLPNLTGTPVGVIRFTNEVNMALASANPNAKIPLLYDLHVRNVLEHYLADGTHEYVLIDPKGAPLSI